MEPFEFFYHTTNMKRHIVKSGVLSEGTHFCCTLLHGDIPDKLPYYGKHRIGIDAFSLMANIFTDGRLYYAGSSKQRRPNHNIWYHNLFVTEDYCPYLEELDIDNNEYLILDHDLGDFLVKENNSGGGIWAGNRYIPEYHWVNVEFDEQIPLECVDYWWD